MENKTEKFFIALSGFFLAVIGILGIKMQNDEKNIQAVLDAPQEDNSALLAMQSEIGNTRDKILSKAAHSPLADTTMEVTTKTVIPGKVITQKVPVSGSISSSSTKTSNKKTSSTKP